MEGDSAFRKYPVVILDSPLKSGRTTLGFV
ncbi:hypothetical protein RDI58_029688 [Solanum bulbocastanum]|uniref:Uncharacterized protein n=1 Tax=Solanum bulbocastanum TaxID=147425 RepID=A0AAN8SQU3_SOLBU